ncbi:hypothetical protein JCM19235_1955 [Vibrio maritimus]|uniref:Uncharacterized protein n=1 Tax=Vibrio maritimus TaxID=990268 RepID=A0A090SGE6_9VIBR|nr:hypothetical protein JCM19235_1955 [Vibrio maritimus]
MLGESNPHKLLSMPRQLFCEWVAYLQVKEGSFKPQKTAEEVQEEQFKSCARILGG